VDTYRRLEELVGFDGDDVETMDTNKKKFIAATNARVTQMSTSTYFQGEEFISFTVETLDELDLEAIERYTNECLSVMNCRRNEYKLRVH